MSTMLVLLIILLILILVVAAVIYISYNNISNKVKRVSKEILGTEDVIQGLKNIEQDSRNTALSISGGTSIYLPRIQSDFPEYHRSTMEEKIKQFIISYYNCLEKKSISYLDNIEVSASVRDEIASQISDLKESNSQFRCDNIKVHAVSIVEYRKTKEFATVKYQISFEYLGNTGKVQAKYEVDVTYLFEDIDIDSFSLRCEHCGAPLKDESSICEYCGSIIVRNIVKVWVVSNFKKLRQVG